MGLVALIVVVIARVVTGRRRDWFVAQLRSLALDLLPLATAAGGIDCNGVDMTRFVPALIDWIGYWK
jgi:hypothetical protein